MQETLSFATPATGSSELDRNRLAFTRSKTAGSVWPRTSKSMDPPVVFGVGTGGVKELALHLDDASVSWALLRFQIGGGTFMRTKFIAVRCNGADTPVMARGYLNARNPEAFALLGETSATLEVSRASELTVEHLCERLLPILAADNLDYSMKDLLQEYAQTVAQAEADAAAEKQVTQVERPSEIVKEEPVIEKPASSMTIEDAVAAVGSEHGAYNWALLEPTRGGLQLYGVGTGGVEEMKKSICEDRILFGALQLTFAGKGGAPHINKYVFVHWVGRSVSPVQRGLLSARWIQPASTLISKSCAITFRRDAHSLADLQLESLIQELRRLTVLDSVGRKDGVLAARLTVESYLSSITEEQQERPRRRSQQPEVPKAPVQEPVAEVEVAAPEQKLPCLSEAIQAVRSPSGRWNWLQVGWPKPSTSNVPTPCRAATLSNVEEKSTLSNIEEKSCPSDADVVKKAATEPSPIMGCKSLDLEEKTPRPSVGKRISVPDAFCKGLRRDAIPPSPCRAGRRLAAPPPRASSLQTGPNA